ncbi:hypothetical protein Tco_1196858 [Tanacetum coccineum]
MSEVVEGAVYVEGLVGQMVGVSEAKCLRVSGNRGHGMVLGLEGGWDWEGDGWTARVTVVGVVGGWWLSWAQGVVRVERVGAVGNGGRNERDTMEGELLSSGRISLGLWGRACTRWVGWDCWVEVLECVRLELWGQGGVGIESRGAGVAVKVRQLKVGGVGLFGELGAFVIGGLLLGCGGGGVGLGTVEWALCMGEAHGDAGSVWWGRGMKGGAVVLEAGLRVICKLKLGSEGTACVTGVEGVVADGVGVCGDGVVLIEGCVGMLGSCVAVCWRVHWFGVVSHEGSERCWSFFVVCRVGDGFLARSVGKVCDGRGGGCYGRWIDSVRLRIVSEGPGRWGGLLRWWEDVWSVAARVKVVLDFRARRIGLEDRVAGVGFSLTVGGRGVGGGGSKAGGTAVDAELGFSLPGERVPLRVWEKWDLSRVLSTVAVRSNVWSGANTNECWLDVFRREFVAAVSRLLQLGLRWRGGAVLYCRVLVRRGGELDVWEVGEHQDSRIKKAQELKTKTSLNSDIKDNSSETKLRGRLLESFQEDAKYEHVGQDTRSQGGKDDQDKQGKDLEISKSKTKSKDNDKGSRSKITQHEGTSLQHNKDQRFKNSTTKQSQQVQGSKIQDLTSGIRRPHIRGDC